MDCTIYSERKNKDEKNYCIEISGHWLCHVTIAPNYYLSPAIVGRIISETSEAIRDELIDKGYLDHPKSEHDWLKVV